MCGIVFLISHKPIEANLLSSMRDTLIHRGPDGFGQVIEQTNSGHWVGLAHRRLSIIDLSDHGKQPMENDDASLVITFNGEIYNYREIRNELSQRGYTFKTQTDTEVLLKAYQEWGADSIRKLNGMFAFVIWDRRKQEAFVARDRFGEKPLYYAHIPSGGIIFASEIKAILAHPEISFKPCEQKIDSYILCSSDLYRTNLTFYKNINSFPAATIRTIDQIGNFKKEIEYWNVDLSEKNSNNNSLSQDKFFEFEELLKKSISLRLNADVSVGACLSGGLDSSSICSLIGDSKYHLNQDFICYSARFDNDPTISEGIYIDTITKKYGFKNQSISPNEQDFLSSVEKLYWHQEKPFLSASIYLEYELYSKIKSQGSKVILDGQGADEILGGYQHYFSDFQLDCLAKKNYLKLLRDTTLFKRRLQKEAQYYTDVKRRFNPNIACTFLELFLNKIYSLVKPLSSQNLNNRLLDGIKYDMLPAQLHAADRNSMAHSIETRFPFLDYNLVDFCLSLNNDYLFSEGWTKHILRKSMDDILPPNIQWRADKVGFAAPQDKWLRGHLKAWAFKKLFEGPVTELSHWNQDKIRKIWDIHQSCKEDTSWALWRWISLAQWLELNFNNFKG